MDSSPQTNKPREHGGLKRKASDEVNLQAVEAPPAPKQKKKIQDPARARASQLYGEIAMNAKHNRLAGAIDSFKTAMSEGIPLNSGLLNTLLYLAVGGGDWEVYARTGKGPDRPSTLQEPSLAGEPSSRQGQEPSDATEPSSSSHPPLAPSPPPEKATLVSFATTLWEHMQILGTKPDNGTYLALARLSAIQGDSDSALGWARECHTQGHQVSLRLYHPAIVSLIVKGREMGDGKASEVSAAVEGIDKEIEAMGKEHLDLTEQEYALILETYSLYGSWHQVASVLHRVGRELGPLSPSTLALITTYFEGTRSREAFLPSSHTIRESQQAEKEVRQRAEADKRNAEQKEKIEASRAQRQAVKPRASSSPEVQREGISEEAVQASTSGRSLRPPAATGAGAATLGAGAATLASGSKGRVKKVPAVKADTGVGKNLEEEKLRRRRRAWLGYPSGASGWEVDLEAKVDPKSGEIVGEASTLGGLEGLKLEVEDLEEDEWASFASSVASLALKNEARQDFQQFVEWFDRNGPYDILVDGANIAFYGQNREGGGFAWQQVMDMVKMLQRENPDKKILLLLHKRRVTDNSARRPAVRNFLDDLNSTNNFFCTPVGSNDDWYWLYATVRAKTAGLLVSNDELRDHIWSLLRPKHFLKWKARHISHYCFSPNGKGGWQPSLQPPPPYSLCVQELSDGSWMLPRADGGWIRIKPSAP